MHQIWTIVESLPFAPAALSWRVPVFAHAAPAAISRAKRVLDVVCAATLLVLVAVLAPAIYLPYAVVAVQVSGVKTAVATFYMPSFRFLGCIAAYRQVRTATFQMLDGPYRAGLPEAVVLKADLLTRDDQTGRLVDLCKALGADRYLAGDGGGAYMNLAEFEAAGITVEFQEFAHPEYVQVYEPFITGMSAIDLLFNCGRDGIELLRKSRRSKA